MGQDPTDPFPGLPGYHCNDRLYDGHDASLSASPLASTINIGSCSPLESRLLLRMPLLKFQPRPSLSQATPTCIRSACILPRSRRSRRTRKKAHHAKVRLMIPLRERSLLQGGCSQLEGSRWSTRRSKVKKASELPLEAGISEFGLNHC